MSDLEQDLDDRSGAVFVVTLVLSITATVFVLLRLASKGLVVRKLTSDDYVIVLAWIFTAGLSVSIMLGGQRGLGAPDSQILPQWKDALKRSVYAFTVLYNPALMATKTAILILYRRMAAAHPFLRYASIATGVIVNLAGLVLTLISAFQCRPVRAGYEQDVDGTCVDVVSLYLSSAPINILTDLAILLLPLPILTRLRMEFKQKCALVATFVVGGFVTVVDVVRIIYLQNALREERMWSMASSITLTQQPPNFTYHASFSLMWSAVEVNVGLMCACVLVLKPLVMRIMPGFLGGSVSRRGSRRESKREKDRLADTPDSGSGSGHASGGASGEREKDVRPELSITVQQPTPVLRKEGGTSPTQPYSPSPFSSTSMGDGGLMIDFPASPKHNLCAIPESGKLPPQPAINGSSSGRGSGGADDEDDGMDFFQMLATDPRCSASATSRLRRMSMSSNAASTGSGGGSQASPGTVHRGRMASDAFTDVTHEAIDERDEEGDVDGVEYGGARTGSPAGITEGGSRIGGGSGGSAGARSFSTSNGRSAVNGRAADGDNEDEEGGMDFFQMLAADPPCTPALTASPLAPPSAYPNSSAPRRRSLVRRATMSMVKRVPGSQGFGYGNGQDPKEPRIPSPPPLPVQEPTQNFFDFVNMKSKTPLTQLGKGEAWWPIMFGESTLPAPSYHGDSSETMERGFAYGLLGTLNAQIQSLLHYSPGGTLALHNAYWIGYLLGPPICGYWVLSREGFKATFMTGLAIYATGAMSFWPSSVLKSYGGFFVSNVIIATGLSVLETAANPFIALAGPGELSEARLCFSQGIQGLGSIISPILAARALFSGIDEEDLFRVQYCYLAVSILVVALAVVFFYVPLSEATDDELEAMAVQRLYNAGLDKGERVYHFGNSFSLDARHLLLWTGVLMMATYVGSQESVSYFWGSIVTEANPALDPFWMQAAGHAAFAFGRFAAAGLVYARVTPRLIMFACMLGCTVTTAVAFAAPPGNTPVAFLILALFFEAPLFPLIFAMTMRGQGKHTKFAATVVTMAVSGGAIWPSVVYAIDQHHPYNSRYAVRVTMGLYTAALFWPVILSVSSKMRKWVDPKWSRIRLVQGDESGRPSVVPVGSASDPGGDGAGGGAAGTGDGHHTPWYARTPRHSNAHVHTHVIDWASPTLGGKREMTHVETAAAPDITPSGSMSRGSHDSSHLRHGVDHLEIMGGQDGHLHEAADWTPVDEKKTNPLGISIPAGWKRKGGLKGTDHEPERDRDKEEGARGRGRKRSVTWEKD